MNIPFCSQCGSRMSERIPDDDDHVRAVCSQCSHVHYENPKMVVGTIPVFRDKILMCCRNIEPRKGKWTLPAGYLENQESVQDGAVRETLEETRARVRLVGPYRMFNILFVDQIYFMFIAELLSLDFGPTKESLEVCLLSEEQMPWDDIAFEVIGQTLKDFFDDRKAQAGNSLKEATYGFKVKDLVFKPRPGTPSL
ncbi:MAG: NUDIX hydrolase [Desulfobacter sp.]|nr:NUDIX hydrolase [Desulfobacter sp.]WDP84842.1 MAG: NUDIX hydrolase [Desulfobacter sp.]